MEPIGSQAESQTDSRTVVAPSKESAYQFALMLKCGSPAREAIRYFLPCDDPNLTVSMIEAVAARWLASPLIQKEILALQGKDWTEMSLTEQLRTAVDKTYVEMAYFLYSRNYVDLSGPERSKADECRRTLEAKLAGTAGKLTAVETFWADVVAGRVKLVGAQPQTSNSLGVAARPQTQAGSQLDS